MGEAAPTGNVGRCDLCSALALGQFWRYAYGRRGVSYTDLRESERSGEAPSGFRALGTDSTFVCRRCERRLIWRGLRDLTRNGPPRMRRWQATAMVATGLLVWSLWGEPATALAPYLFAGLAGIALLRGFGDRDPETMRLLVLSMRRPALGRKHGVDPNRLELVP